MRMYSLFSKFIIVAAVLLLVLISPSWGLFAIIGFSIGFIIRSSIIAFVRYRKLARYVVVVVLLITGLAVVILFIAPLPMYRIVLPQIESVRYSGHMIYSHTDNLWKINEEIQIDEERIEVALQKQVRYKLSETSKQRQSPTVADMMSSHGWDASGMIDRKLRFSRQRKQAASIRWFPVYTINTISIPVIKHHDLILRPDNQSQVMLDVPKQMVAITYPSYSSRVDLLKDNREQLTIPITLASEDEFTLRIQVVSRLFRNPVGQTIIKVSIWSPIKWIIFLLCAIFAEQIKKGILIPFVRRAFQLLGIPYLGDKKQH